MATVSKRLRFEVLRRDNHACRYCGAAAPEVQLVVDAVVPEALGGSHRDPANLVAACVPCNSGKSSTHPDSPLLADVADDALRWAVAIKAAAAQAIADTSQQQAIHESFDQSWRGWTWRPHSGTEKQSVPRPDNWRTSVDAFIAAGLPADLLPSCIRKAMESRADPAGTWRYMCGVAWRKIGEIQEAAKQALATDADGDFTASERAARLHLARELLGSLTENERAIEIDETRGMIGEDEDLEVYAAACAFHAAAVSRRRLTRLLRFMLDVHPDGERFKDRAYELLEVELGSFNETDLVERAAALLQANCEAAGTGA